MQGGDEGKPSQEGGAAACLSGSGNFSQKRAGLQGSELHPDLP